MKLLYLTVGSSFEEASAGKSAGAPGDEGDMDRPAVDDKLCRAGVREQDFKPLNK